MFKKSNREEYLRDKLKKQTEQLQLQKNANKEIQMLTDALIISIMNELGVKKLDLGKVDVNETLKKYSLRANNYHLEIIEKSDKVES